MSNIETAVGAWTGFHFEVSAEDKATLEKVLKHWVGVEYTPVAVATQPVAGTNYCFLCKGVTIVPELPETAYLVYIYQPPTGDAILREIKQIKP